MASTEPAPVRLIPSRPPVQPPSGPRPESGPDQLETVVVAMARTSARLSTSDVIGHRDRARAEVVEAALSVIPGLACAGLSLLRPDGRISSDSPSGTRAERLGQAQAVLNEGPGVSALGAAAAITEPLWVADMGDPADGGRWPRFAAEAQRNRVGSMLSMRLPGGAGASALALNLYAERAAAFDPTARRTAALFSSHAAITLRAAEHITGLERALASRDVIAQAKGILIERHHISGDDAFALLVEASQHTNRKLRDAAAWLVARSAMSSDVEPVPANRHRSGSGRRRTGSGPGADGVRVR